jgi:hypothetical protein
MHQREFSYPRRLPTLLSPLILGRGGDLQVLRTRSHRDVRSGKDLSPLPHLKIQLKKFNLKLKMPLKWQLNLKLRKSLKDSILKMETTMRRAKNIAWGDRNAPTQSFWEIMMSGWMIMRRLLPIMWNQESHIIDSKIADSLDPDPEPKSMIECRKCSDWEKWKAAIVAELRSLYKREVFGPAVPTPPNVIPVGCKWVFLRKRNEHGQVVRYKARLVAQGFTQRLGIDYDETYSPVMSGITFRYLISMAANLNLQMQLMDVVTAYLYGSLDSEIHMRVPERLKIPGPNQNRNMFSIRLQRSLYGLKQSRRMWFNRLCSFLLQRGYINNDDCPCVFIKKSSNGFCIISVYVDDLNIIGTTRDIEEAMAYLKTEFEMKDLGKTKFCLVLQLEHLPKGVFVHQSTYQRGYLKSLI